MIALFTQTFSPSTIGECNKMMTLLDIKDWWMDNIGKPPEDLSKQLIDAGYKSESLEDVVMWPLLTTSGV